MTAALHPQSVVGEPLALRWVTEVDHLPVGRVLAAPGTLGPLLEYGVLTKVFVERGGVWTWLDPARNWPEHGPRIRDAVATALELDGWVIEENQPELLALIARDILDGELRSYVSSHGGIISVAGSTASTLSLDFGGACADCPAAGSTLHDRIEASVRARYPLLESIERVGEPAERAPRGWLGLPIARRRG